MGSVVSVGSVGSVGNLGSLGSVGNLGSVGREGDVSVSNHLALQRVACLFRTVVIFTPKENFIRCESDLTDSKNLNNLSKFIFIYRNVTDRANSLQFTYSLIKSSSDRNIYEYFFQLLSLLNILNNIC